MKIATSAIVCNEFKVLPCLKVTSVAVLAGIPGVLFVLMNTYVRDSLLLIRKIELKQIVGILCVI